MTTTGEAMAIAEAVPRASRTRNAYRRDRVLVAAALVVAVQVVAVAVFGVITISKYPLWSPIDEGAHFDNVVYVAAHGSYPVLGKTPASEQVLAIHQGIYPRHTTINPRTAGLTGLAYEAFQPPLYYYVAVPVTLLSGNYRTKAFLLRFFGLLLLMAAIALFARLSRHVLGRRWLFGMSAGMLVFLMPGVVVRMVTISNLALAVPLAILIVTELYLTWKRRSWHRLPWCGLLVGLGVLTDMYLVDLAVVYLVLAGALLLGERRTPVLAAGAGGGLLAAAVVSPWLIFNQLTYHALTATSLAKQEQTPIINPHHVHYAFGRLPSLTVQILFQPLLPEEWSTRLNGHIVFGYGATLFQLLVVPTALVAAVWMGRHVRALWVLFAPFALNVVMAWYTEVGQQWPVLASRYVYPTLAPVALFSMSGLAARVRSLLPALVAVAAATVFLIALWIHLVPTIHSP